MPAPWNTNIHYDATLAMCVREDVTCVLDVGCGDGFLAARLARLGRRVVAIDIDEAVLRRARTRFPDAAVSWRQGDVLTADLPVASFDAVVSNATLHHFPDTASALHRLRRLVRPGGMLAIVTFVRMTWRDLPWALVAFAVIGVANRVRHKWEHSAPQRWPPPYTLRQLRRYVDAALPGARVSRLVMGRCLIVWPEADPVTNDGS